MDMPRETRDRIFAAADSLFEQAGRDTFPTVDAVRRVARVNMNDASAGMKEWRRAQTVKTAPVVVQVPDVVQQTAGAAIATIWQQAQQLANESLEAAQVAWDAERAEVDTLRRELSDAYEAQATELEQARAQIEQQEQAIKRAEQQAAQAAAAQESARTAHAALSEAQKRADGLAGLLEQERAATEAAREKAEKAIVEAAKLAGKLEGLRSVEKNAKR